MTSINFTFGSEVSKLKALCEQVENSDLYGPEDVHNLQEIFQRTLRRLKTALTQTRTTLGTNPIEMNSLLFRLSNISKPRELEIDNVIMKLTKDYICTHNEKKTTFSSLFDYMKTPFDRAQNIKDLFSLIAKEFGLEEDTNPYDFFKEHPNPTPEEINDEFDGTIIFSLFTEKFTLDLNVDDKIFPTSVKITDETKSKQLPNEVCENVLFLIKYDQQSFFNLFHQCQYVGELAALYDAASSFYETIATSFPSFRRELTLSGQRFTYFEASSSSLLQPHYIELRSCKCNCLSSSTHYIATLTPSVFFFDSSPFRSHENTALENFSTVSRLSEIPSVYTNNDGIEVVQKDAFLSVFGTTMKISVNDSQIRKEVKVFSFLTLEELCSKLKQIKRQAAFNTLLKSLLDEKTFPSQTKEMNPMYRIVVSPHFHNNVMEINVSHLTKTILLDVVVTEESKVEVLLKTTEPCSLKNEMIAKLIESGWSIPAALYYLVKHAFN